MKNKQIVIGTILVMLSTAFLFSMKQPIEKKRIHQHLEPQIKSQCNHSNDLFCTHLPIVAINTGGQLLEAEKIEKWQSQSLKEKEWMGQVDTIDHATKKNHLEDEPETSRSAWIQYRGNSSIYFDKKSYKIHFINDDLSENKEGGLLGMPPHVEWVLHGPFLDKTLLRNYMCMNLSGEIMPDTPEVRFCEVIVDGIYKGVYVAMESVARGKDRINISAYKGKDIWSSYILRQDRKGNKTEEINNFASYSEKMAQNTALEVIYPKEVLVDAELKSSIEKEFSKFEKTLYSFDYKDKQYGYSRLIDRGSFVDYFIINEFLQNYDAGIFSTYFYKDLRGKIHIGPVWDFDNACDNYIEPQYDETGFEMVYYTRYKMLVKDEKFVDAIISRYRYLRKGVLSEDYLLNYIDETVTFLGDAVDRNNAVWGYSFDTGQLDGYSALIPLERNLESYEEAISQLKQFIIKRGRWMDEHIEQLKQYCHPSVNKKFNH